MIQYTAKARYTDTRLIRHLIITASLLCPWGGGGGGVKPAFRIIKTRTPR